MLQFLRCGPIFVNDNNCINHIIIIIIIIFLFLIFFMPSVVIIIIIIIIIYFTFFTSVINVDTYAIITMMNDDKKFIFTDM